MPSVDYDPERDADRDLFAVLGTAWEADADTVRRAWRTAGRSAHPDAGGSHEAFIAVQHAWEVLSDPSRRTRYVRAYEARHGPQGPRAGTRRSGHRARGGRSTRGRPRRASAGPIRPRCAGLTRTGMPCGNRAAEGSDRCWRHADTGTTADPAPPRPDETRRTPWRCEAVIRSERFDLPCMYNRLVGEARCWDHATDAQRRAALQRVDPGRCAALTQHGRPCRNRCSSLGFPLCESHLTVGIFTTYDRHAPRPQSPPRTAPNPDPRSSREPRREAAPPVVLHCPACGRRNRVRAGGRPRCGSCRADLFAAPVPPAPGTQTPTDTSRPRPAAATTPPPAPTASAATTPNSPPPPPRAASPPPTYASAGSATAHFGPTPAPPSGGSTSTATVAPRVQPWSPTGPDGPQPRSFSRSFTATSPRQSQRGPGTRARHPTLVVLAAVAVLLAGVVGLHRWQLEQPVTLGFEEDIKATSARCASGEALTRDDVIAGFEMTCTMVDASPGNRDRPYVQVRLDGCNDWHRLDHDDSAEPVAITTRLTPCGSESDTLQWQVCQTHGGLLPDDCEDGTTDLPSR